MTLWKNKSTKQSSTETLQKRQCISIFWSKRCRMYIDSRQRHFLPNTTSQRTQNQHHNARPVPPWMRFDENQNLPMVRIFLLFPYLYHQTHSTMLGWKSPAEAFQGCRKGERPQTSRGFSARQDAMRSLSAMGVSFSRSHPGMEKQQNLLKEFPCWDYRVVQWDAPPKTWEVKKWRIYGNPLLRTIVLMATVTGRG